MKNNGHSGTHRAQNLLLFPKNRACCHKLRGSFYLFRRARPVPVHDPSSFAPFLLAELLLGRAEEPFPFLSSVGYTNGITLLCNGFPCFSFGFISNIVGKLALQDAFICLHVFCNYCQLSGSKIWFPFSFFGNVSGILFRIHVYTDTEKFRPSLPSQCFIHRQPARVALNFPPNLSVMWESPLLEDLFLE